MIVRVRQDKNTECQHADDSRTNATKGTKLWLTNRPVCFASAARRATVTPCVFQQLRAFPGSRAGNTGDGLLRADANSAPRVSNHFIRQRSHRYLPTRP